MRPPVREQLRIAGLAAVILPVGALLTGAFAKAGETSAVGILLVLALWFFWAIVVYLPVPVFYWQFAKSTQSPEGGPGGRVMHLQMTRVLPLTVMVDWMWANQSPQDFGPDGSLPAVMWFCALPTASVYTAVLIAGVVRRRSIQRHGSLMSSKIREFSFRSWWSSIRSRFLSKAGKSPGGISAEASVEPPPNLTAERIDPAWFYRGSGIWNDVAIGVAMQAVFIVAISYTASGIRTSIAGLVGGWGSLLSHAVPWTAKEAVQVILGLWLVQGASRALTEGLRDYEFLRLGIFAVLTVPPLLVLLAGIWIPGLIGGAITNLVVVVAVGLLSPAPPEATFGKFAAAKALLPRHRVKTLAGSLGSAFTWPVRRAKCRLAAPRGVRVGDEQATIERKQ